MAFDPVGGHADALQAEVTVERVQQGDIEAGCAAGACRAVRVGQLIDHCIARVARRGCGALGQIGDHRLHDTDTDGIRCGDQRAVNKYVECVVECRASLVAGHIAVSALNSSTTNSSSGSLSAVGQVAQAKDRIVAIQEGTARAGAARDRAAGQHKGRRHAGDCSWRRRERAGQRPMSVDEVKPRVVRYQSNLRCAVVEEGQPGGQTIAQLKVRATFLQRSSPVGDNAPPRRVPGYCRWCAASEVPTSDLTGAGTNTVTWAVSLPK